MPTILSRLRGLLAPTAGDEPFRLADSGGVIPGTGGGVGKSSGGGGRRGEPGDRGRPGLPGRKGVDGAAGASGGQQFGAYWVCLGGGVITLPLNAVERVMNAAGTIKEVVIVTKGGTGSCTVNIYKATLSSHYPPVSGDDITGGVPPAILAGTIYQNSTLTGWTTAFAQDDCFLFTLSATSNFTTVEISLRI